MIDPRFTVMGLWLVAVIITFTVVGLLAFAMSNTLDYGGAFILALVMFVLILELFLCSMYVTLKTNPESYGYTRIEQEVSE